MFLLLLLLIVSSLYISPVLHHHHQHQHTEFGAYERLANKFLVKINSINFPFSLNDPRTNETKIEKELNLKCIVSSFAHTQWEKEKEKGMKRKRERQSGFGIAQQKKCPKMKYKIELNRMQSLWRLCFLTVSLALRLYLSHSRSHSLSLALLVSPSTSI